MSQEVELTMICHRKVEFNNLSSLSWRLREEEMGSWLRWSCRYLGRACASPPRGLSHPPVSKYPGPGFPMTWPSPPLPQVHLCEPGRGHHPVQLCLLSVPDTPPGPGVSITRLHLQLSQVRLGVQGRCDRRSKGQLMAGSEASGQGGPSTPLGSLSPEGDLNPAQWA